MTAPRAYPTLPVLLGADDTLGPSLASLTDTIGSLINPNAKFQHALRLAFIEKPELMQTFVDVEKKNPGTLKALGFGDAGSDILTRMQESIPGTTSRLLQPLIAKELGTRDSEIARLAATKAATGGETPGSVAADTFAEFFAKTGGKMLKEDPDMFNEYVRARFGLKSEVEAVKDREELSIIRNVDELVGKGVPDLKRMIMDGSLNAQTISAGLQNPKTKPALLLAIAEHQQDRDYQEKALYARYRADANDPITNIKLRSTVEAWERSGKKGSLGGWYSAMWKENTFGGPEAGDETIIPEAMKQANVLQEIKQSQEIYRAVEPTIQRLRGKGTKNLTTEDTQVEVDNLNATLKSLNSPWRAEWFENDPWYRGPKNKLIFVDGAGNITENPADLISGTPPIGAPKIQDLLAPQMSPEERMLVGQLQNLSAEQRKAYYPAMEKADPVGASRIKRYFNDE